MTTPLNAPDMALPVQLRVLAKKALTGHVRTKELTKRPSDMTKEELIVACNEFGIDIKALNAFSDDMDAAEVTDAATPRAAPVIPNKAEIEAQAETIVQGLLQKFASGDPMGFNTGLRSLAAASLTPAVVEIEKIIEKVVEREKLVTVELSADPHLRPAHVPQPTDKRVSFFKGSPVTLAVWDAPDAPAVDDYYIWPRGTLSALSKINRGLPGLLTGPAGTGKTSFAEQVAARTSRPFVRISCHEQTDGPTLVGQIVPDGKGSVRWMDGQLTKAIRRPGTVILIDEPSTARPGAMMALQAVLEPNGALHIEQTGECVKVAPGVVFILADNTNGSGDTTGAYEGTRRMNRATLDRMSYVLPIDYLNPAQEIALLHKRTSLDTSRCADLVKYANDARKKAGEGAMTHGLGFRRLFSFALALVDTVPADEAFETTILAGAPGDDQEALSQLAKLHFGDWQKLRAAA